MRSSGLRAGFANTLTMPGWFQLDLSVGQRFDPPDLGTLHARLALVNALDRVIELRNGTGLGVGLAPQYAQAARRVSDAAQELLIRNCDQRSRMVRLSFPPRKDCRAFAPLLVIPAQAGSAS